MFMACVTRACVLIRREDTLVALNQLGLRPHSLLK
jgi:hypothetical protein